MARFVIVVVAAAVFNALAPSAFAEPLDKFSGNWLCAMCGTMNRSPEILLSHVSVSIVADGLRLNCRNNFGEASEGRILSERSLTCFGMTGVLSENGESIRWDKGREWSRDHTQAF